MTRIFLCSIFLMLSALSSFAQTTTDREVNDYRLANLPWLRPGQVCSMRSSMDSFGFAQNPQNQRPILKPTSAESTVLRSLETASVLLNQYLELAKLADFSDIDLDQITDPMYKLSCNAPFQIRAAEIFRFHSSEQIQFTGIVPFRNRAAFISNRHKSRAFRDFQFVKLIPEFPTVEAPASQFALVFPIVPLTDEIDGFAHAMPGAFADSNRKTLFRETEFWTFANRVLSVDYLAFLDASHLVGQSINKVITEFDSTVISMTRLLHGPEKPRAQHLIAKVRIGGKVFLVDHKIAKNFPKSTPQADLDYSKQKSNAISAVKLVASDQTTIPQIAVAKTLKTIGAMLTELGERIESAPHNAKTNRQQLFQHDRPTNINSLHITRRLSIVH